ncbi:MAG: PorT family protein [Bacteroidaceae bacterium]|nr:PorT family protein [Bacteroidaceae bacterium]
MRARLFVSIVIFAFALVGVAQERKVQNKPFIDERLFHYGFFFGFNDQGLSLENNGYIDSSTGAQWSVENDKMNIGFSVGVLGDWRINRYVSLRLLPSLHFGSKHLMFLDHHTGDKETQDMKSAYISLPANIKLAGPRFNNYRPYVVGGLSVNYDLTAKKHTLLRTKPMNLCIEAGLGCDFYLPFFKMIPELKFCFGLGDVLDKDRDDLLDSTQKVFTQSVNRATTNMVVLTLYFE